MNSRPLNFTYCLPVIASSVDEAVDEILAAHKQYGMIEIWFDYFADLTSRGLDPILEAIGERTALFLSRRQNLEQPILSLAEQQAIIRSLPKSAWVDFDITSQRDLLTWCRTECPPLTRVVSYHNYKETPHLKELHTIAEEMHLQKADLIKFSTFCRAPQDALSLLQLLVDLKGRGERAIVLGMGEEGIPLRIVGPLWGSEIAYAPQDVTKSSAPGQLSLKQLSAILQELTLT